MTTTSPGTHEFPTKYFVAALVAAVIVAAIFAIAQWAGTESQPSVASPSEATFETSTELVQPNAGPNGLSEALAEGKLDAGLVPVPSQPATGSSLTPETVMVSGQGGLYEALMAGKFGMEFASQSPGVQYVRGTEASARANDLAAALAAGKLDAGLVPAPGQPAAGSSLTPETVMVSGQGGLYEALMAGKFGMEFTSQSPGVQYVRGTEASANANDLAAALAAGKLDAGLTPAPSQPATRSDVVPETVMVSGQGGLYEALMAGKFGTDFTSQNPGVQYVRSPEASANVGSLWSAFEAGKLDAGLIPTPGQPAAGSSLTPETVVVSGQGGLYEALLSGKLDMDASPSVQYTTSPETEATTSGLWAAFTDGKFAVDSGEPAAQSSPAAKHTPTLSGGHQE